MSRTPPRHEDSTLRTVEVVDNPTERRYEARVGGVVVGVSEYRQAGSRRIFVHTEVAPDHEGKGVGGRLAQAALDDVRARGMRLTAHCPFIAGYLERHPEYADLVAVRGRTGGPRP